MELIRISKLIVISYDQGSRSIVPSSIPGWNSVEKPGVGWGIIVYGRSKVNDTDLPAVLRVSRDRITTRPEGVCGGKEKKKSATTKNSSRRFTRIPTRALAPPPRRMCSGVATYPTWECVLEKFLHNTRSPTDRIRERNIIVLRVTRSVMHCSSAKT